MSFVISSYPAPMPTARVDCQSPAVSEVARSLAGQARWLYEMATGESAESGAAAEVLRNPQGLIGIDHSGAPYGVGLQHPIATGGNPIHKNIGTYWVDAPDPVFTSTRGVAVNTTIWVKPHPDGPGPYSEGLLQIRAQAVGATGSVVLRVVDSEGRSHEETRSVTSGSTAVYDGPSIPLVSGANAIEILITTTQNIRLSGWSINQTVQVRDG